MRRALLLMLAVFTATVGLRAQGSAPGQATTIQGEVRLPNGNPAADVTLKLQAESAGGVYLYATTDSAGYYAFSGPGIVVGDNYIVDCDVQGYEPEHRLVMVTALVTQEDFSLQAVPSDKPEAKNPVVSVEQLEVPANAREVFQKGIFSMEHKQPADAEASFEKAIGLYPKYAAAYECLSAVLADQKKFPHADEAIHQAIQIDGNTSNTYSYMGYVYMRESHPRLARQAFQHSLNLSKDNWFAQLEMGRLLYQEGDYQGAYPYLEAAHQLHGQNLAVHLMVYNDLTQLNRKAEALVELDEILAHFPRSHAAARLRVLRPALAEAAAGQASPGNSHL